VTRRPASSETVAGRGSGAEVRLADVALIGMATFLVIVVLMHVLRADLDPADRAISEYARGHLGWLMTVAWSANGVAVLALAAGLRRSLAPVPRSGAATALILQGVFAHDPRWRSMARPTNWFARGLLGLFVARVSVVLARLPGSAGLVQRVLWVILLGWLFWVAWHLRGIDTTADMGAAHVRGVAL
jgi:hypothetical protein